MTPAFWTRAARRSSASIDAAGDGPRHRHLVDRQALLRRHGPVGVHRRRRLLGATAASTEDGPPARRTCWMTVQHLQDSFTALEQARMPVLAAIQGGCIGGAVDMVCASDMRYATADAFFCIQEINIGMTADVGTLQRLPKIIPEGIARELAYTGDRMPAPAGARGRARQRGVRRPRRRSSPACSTSPAASPPSRPLAIWGTKEMINYTRDHSVADSLRYIAGWQTGMFQPGDMMEEFAAKAEKREPKFEDLPPRPTPGI